MFIRDGKADPQLGAEAMTQALEVHRSKALKGVSMEEHLPALVALADRHLGNDTVFEADNLDGDTLDFSQFTVRGQRLRLGFAASPGNFLYCNLVNRDQVQRVCASISAASRMARAAADGAAGCRSCFIVFAMTT
jgi:hypothetical protein